MSLAPAVEASIGIDTADPTDVTMAFDSRPTTLDALDGPPSLFEPGRMSACPFCEVDHERVFHEGAHVSALWDAFPVSEGHALIVPRRHVASWFDASPEEQAELASTIALVRDAIERRHRPDGYNIGVNVGAAAGQTVGHLHVHVIPRYTGDVEDPRGGVRWVLPARAAYWKDAK